MCENWGYLALSKKYYDESIGEMKHAEELIKRILFLEGTPNMTRYDKIKVGDTVKKTVGERSSD
jgi:bacterioferritin